MATTLKLRTDIKKLKGALSSKSLPAPIKAKLKAQLDKAQNELKAMQSGAKPRKVSTTKGTQTALTSLQKLVSKKKFSVYQGKGIDLKKDADQGALAVGRRVSKGIKGNQFGDAKSSKGNVYYEYRANRLDVKQPKKAQKYPKLEKGGELDEKYEIELFFKGLSGDGRKIGKYVITQKTLDRLNEYLREDWSQSISLDVIDESDKKPTSWYDLKSDVYKKSAEKFGKMEDGGMMAKGGMSQGYDDREDERLGMKDGKMSMKDLDSTHARRDDARFEERMAKGGVTEKEVVESNAEMVLSKIKEVHHHADELGDIVTNKSDIEAWVVAKIERASTDLSDITHYLDGQHEKMSMGGSINNYVHKMDKK